MRTNLKPSITKSEFYKHYLNVVLLDSIKKRNGNFGLSDYQLYSMIKRMIEPTSSSNDSQEIIKNVCIIDSLFSSKGNYLNKLSVNATVSPDFEIEAANKIGDYIELCSSFGTLTSTQSGYFRLSEGLNEKKTLRPVNEEELMDYLANYAGKNCFVRFYRGGKIEKINNDEYSIEVDLYKKDDYNCRPSFKLKYRTDNSLQNVILSSITIAKNKM